MSESTTIRGASFFTCLRMPASNFAGFDQSRAESAVRRVAPRAVAVQTVLVQSPPHEGECFAEVEEVVHVDMTPEASAESKPYGWILHPAIDMLVCCGGLVWAFRRIACLQLIQIAQQIIRRQVYGISASGRRVSVRRRSPCASRIRLRLHPVFCDGFLHAQLAPFPDRPGYLEATRPKTEEGTDLSSFHHQHMQCRSEIYVASAPLRKL